MNTPTDKLRLFIALPLSEQVERSLADILADLQAAEPGAPIRWVKPASIHLTTRFLGDTDPDLVPKLIDTIDRTARTCRPVSATIDRLGGFPNLRRPRVLWVGLKEDEAVETIGNLARQVELEVRKLRFEPEKRGFKPHLTLGRVKAPHGLERIISAIEHYQLDPIELPLDRLVLFRSELTPRGAIYTRLHEQRLGQ